MEIYPNSCPDCGGTCKAEIQSGWFTCQKCGKKYPRFALDHSRVERETAEISNAIEFRGMECAGNAGEGHVWAKRKVCPYCNGTALDLYGDSGGSCPHCFGGYTR